MAEATKVLYDVSQAVKELNKLNKKVEESGDKAEESFDEGASSASLFDKALGKVGGTASKVAGSVRGVATAVGGVGAVAAVAAAGVAAVVAQFIDLDEILKDSVASIEEFEKATQRVLNAREAISNIGDQAVNRDFRLAQRSLRLARAENARAQNSVETEKLAAKARLDVFKDELRRRESALKGSLDREQALRDRLADRAVSGQEFGGFDADLRAAKLNDAARQAAADGDIDRAEALEQAAKDVAREAQNQSFALADAQATNEAINGELQKQIDAEAKVGDAAQNAVDAYQQRVDKLQEEVDLLEKRAVLLRQESRDFGAQTQELRVGKQEAGDQQQADTAARTFQKASADFSFNLKSGGTSLKESVVNAGSEFAKFLTDEAGRQAALRQFEQAGGAAGRIQRALSDQDGLTAADVEALSGDFGLLSDAVAKLEANTQKLTAGAAQELERLSLLQDSVQDAFNAAASFRQVRTDDQVITEGSRGPTAAQQDALRESLTGLTDAIKEQSRGTAAPAAATAIGAPPQAGATRQTVTVNANVKGGIIDAEVTREITRIIQEEIRKGTGQKPQ
jgi:hypothetical protein